MIRRGVKFTSVVGQTAASISLRISTSPLAEVTYKNPFLILPPTLYKQPPSPDAMKTALMFTRPVSPLWML
jgi:hypothetical protein